MKHTSQSIREALDAKQRVLLCGDEVTQGDDSTEWYWAGFSWDTAQINHCLRCLQDKVEIVEPEPLWIEGIVQVGASLYYPYFVWGLPPAWKGEGVVVIRKSDLPEALKQLAETAKEGEER